MRAICEQITSNGFTCTLQIYIDAVDYLNRVCACKRYISNSNIVRHPRHSFVNILPRAFEIAFCAATQPYIGIKM